MREETDPNYNPANLEINDEIEALIYQIRMSLGTNKGEVLGEPDFGCDLESIMFTTEFYAVSFNTVITDQIRKYSELAQYYPVAVQAYEYPTDPYRSAVLLDIKINDKSTFGMLLGD